MAAMTGVANRTRTASRCGASMTASSLLQDELGEFV